MRVSINGGDPQIIHNGVFSIINHPFWSTPIYGNPHIAICMDPIAFWGRVWRYVWYYILSGNAKDEERLKKMLGKKHNGTENKRKIRFLRGWNFDADLIYIYNYIYIIIYIYYVIYIYIYNILYIFQAYVARQPISRLNLDSPSVARVSKSFGT